MVSPLGWGAVGADHPAAGGGRRGRVWPVVGDEARVPVSLVVPGLPAGLSPRGPGLPGAGSGGGHQGVPMVTGAATAAETIWVTVVELGAREKAETVTPDTLLQPWPNTYSDCTFTWDSVPPPGVSMR